MVEKFKNNVVNLATSPADETVYLLAVSGGVDSVVMAHLFHQAGFKCAIAHCNFNLRGEESDADEAFVKKLASHFGFAFYSQKFQTTTFATDNKLSIRKLRYGFFQELIQLHKFKAVMVAHHANDVAETMLLNLTRGTGLAGMHGIKAVNENIIRPLLIFNRKEILEYANQHKISWREDASNAVDYYSRNKLRLNVFPQLEELNPKVVDAFVKHADWMSGYEKLLAGFIQTIESSLLHSSYNNAVFSLNLEKLHQNPEPQLVLYHIIKKFGFSEAVIREVFLSKIGAEFFSTEFKMVIGRNELAIFKIAELAHNEEYYLSENETAADMRFGSFKMSRIAGRFQFDKKLQQDITFPSIAYLDGDKLKFPLKIRRWKQGDYFYPLGMKGKKLLSDYFTDEKFSPAQKELIYLVLSGNEIVWVAGHRIDDRFKVTDKTLNLRRFFWSQSG
jgi:tRNA(Ile)-lysidine synthase